MKKMVKQIKVRMCGDCFVYCAPESGYGVVFGECRAHPPVVTDPVGPTEFPCVHEDWFCGEFTPNK